MMFCTPLYLTTCYLNLLCILLGLFQNENARNENSGLLGILSTKRMSKRFHSWEEMSWELIRGSEKSIAGSCIFLLIPFFQINRFQNDSVHSTFGGGMTRIVFRSFWNWNVTQKNASCFSSVCSHSGIVPHKECTLSIHIKSCH